MSNEKRPYKGGRGKPGHAGNGKPGNGKSSQGSGQGKFNQGSGKAVRSVSVVAAPALATAPALV